MALFKQFGFEDPVGEEAEAVARKINEADPQITWPIFQEIVDNLKKRKILKGEFTLTITPKALHIKLWTEWWDIYGRTFNLDEFIQDFPCDSKLIEWFYEMFSYASESGVALSAVKDLLGPNGPFQQRNYLQTSLGGPFFLALTEAAPESALECLKKTVGTWDEEILSQFVGRTYVILALEKIAVWNHLFADAAKLLLVLGDAKFAELFLPAPGGVAPTETSPKERFPVLEGAFESESKTQRDLGLKACNMALESSYFTRFGNPEYQGLRQKPKLWAPKTEGEFRDALRRVWKFLDKQLARLSKDECKKGATILLKRAREMVRIPELTKIVVHTVTTIVKEEYVNEKHVIETINRILRNNGEDMPAEARGLWEQLMSQLVSPDFPSMMRRFVGMELLEDLQFDDNKNYIDRAQLQIEELAQQAVDDVNLLQSELDWLVTDEAKKGYDFGFELGTRDNGFSLLPTLLKAQRNADDNASTAFLGGYFRALFESDADRREAQFEAMINDTKLKPLIPALTSRSGLTDEAGLRLLRLARDGTMGINDFKTFTYGKAVDGLSGEIVTEWIEFLLGVSDQSGASIALNLYHCYYIFQKPARDLPLDVTFRLLRHQSLFEGLDGYQFDSTMTAYYWTEIAKVFLHLDSEKDLEFAEFMLSHFGEDDSIVGPYSQTCSILDEITDRCPAEIWTRTGSLLESQPHSSRTIALEQWLREGSSWGREESKAALLRIPCKIVWEWIDEDIENRAWYFAYRLVPITHLSEEWMASMVRSFLSRYGNRKEVRSRLMGNYLSGAWHGPPSLHYQAIRDKLLWIKDIEDDENVIRWIDEFAAGLKAQVEQERMHEEREP